MEEPTKKIEVLVCDTSGFIGNASFDDSLYNIASQIVTCKDVVNEVTDKRQLNRLTCLPYELEIKEPFSENIKLVTEFSKRTGDYPSLSSTDIKVMALTYQLEKEKVGTQHLRTEPIIKQSVTTQPPTNIDPDITGFYLPKNIKNGNPLDLQDLSKIDLEDPKEESGQQCDKEWITQTKLIAKEKPTQIEIHSEGESEETEDEDDDEGWITPSNIAEAKKQVHSAGMKEENVTVACLTTDFAMQNVLRQMNLNVATTDGRIIKELRTFILRCYTCFKTTSIMTKQFCPKCGNNTLKKVAVSLDENGKMQIHINPRKRLSTRGKKFSLPKIQGGKHPNNPRLVEDQPMADNKPSRLAKTKTNALDDDYIAGFSPFATRDVMSKSAQLGIRPGTEFKHWMKKNPNESRRRRK